MTHEKLDNLYLIDLQIKFINIKIIYNEIVHY